MSLRKFLVLASGASGDADFVVTGYRRPLGYMQILNANLATATTIAAGGGGFPVVPAGQGIRYAVIQCNGGVVRWRDDGSAPTASVGMSLPDGGELTYVGDIKAIQFISSSGTPIVDISIYD